MPNNIDAFMKKTKPYLEYVVTAIPGLSLVGIIIGAFLIYDYLAQHSLQTQFATAISSPSTLVMLAILLLAVVVIMLGVFFLPFFVLRMIRIAYFEVRREDDGTWKWKEDWSKLITFYLMTISPTVPVYIGAAFDWGTQRILIIMLIVVAIIVAFYSYLDTKSNLNRRTYLTSLLKGSLFVWLYIISLLTVIKALYLLVGPLFSEEVLRNIINFLVLSYYLLVLFFAVNDRTYSGLPAFLLAVIVIIVGSIIFDSSITPAERFRLITSNFVRDIGLGNYRSNIVVRKEAIAWMSYSGFDSLAHPIKDVVRLENIWVAFRTKTHVFVAPSPDYDRLISIPLSEILHEMAVPLDRARADSLSILEEAKTQSAQEDSSEYLRPKAPIEKISMKLDISEIVSLKNQYESNPMYIIGSIVNMRQSPSTSSPVIKKLTRNSVVYKQNTDPEIAKWSKVKYREANVWDNHGISKGEIDSREKLNALYVDGWIYRSVLSTIRPPK